MAKLNSLLVGDRNCKLEIVEILGSMPFPKQNSVKRVVLKVKCDCGNIKNIPNYTFKTTQSCGCIRENMANIFKVGDKHNRLTIIEDLGRTILPNTKTLARCVRCLCDCGNEITSQWTNVNQGNVKSCGCLQSETSSNTVKIMQEKNFVHGDSKKKTKFNRLYNVWCRMRQRCYNPKQEKYKWYGGSGIRICDEWLDDYLSFKNWALSNGYKDDLTIDRIDVTKDYSPENCQWLTAQENIEKEYTTDRETRRAMLEEII